MKKMKKCPKCGAVQNPSRTSCIDCGTLLGDAHSEFTKELDENVNRTLERKMDYDDSSSPLYYIKRVIIALNVIAVLGSIILLVLFRGRNNTMLLLFSLVICTVSLLVSLFPRHASMVLRSRRFYRAPMTPKEADYIDSGERIVTMFIAVLFLVMGIAAAAYFLVERPPLERERVTFETMEDGSYKMIERVG